MKALWLQNRKLTYRDDVPAPAPAEGDALVAVDLAGICGTDLELLAGYYSFEGIPGHEFVGRILEAPARPGWVGRRVVGEINVSCRECTHCLAGRPRHCSRRRVLGIKNHGGAFAEFLRLPIENLVPVPETVGDEAAVFVEPLGAALRIRDQVSIGPGCRVLVIGAGRLGQLVARTIQPTGCRLKVVTRSGRSRQCGLLERLGISCVPGTDLEAGAFDLVVEASGDPGGWQLAQRSVRPEGTIVLKSTYRSRLPVDVSSIVVNEIRLIGSRCGPFEPAIELLADRGIDPLEMIETRYPLKMGAEAFAHAARPGVLKVLLQISG